MINNQDPSNLFASVTGEDAIQAIRSAYYGADQDPRYAEDTKKNIINTLNGPQSSNISNEEFVRKVNEDISYTDIKSGRSKEVLKDKGKRKFKLRQRPNAIASDDYEKLHGAGSYGVYMGVEIDGEEKILIRKEFAGIPTMEYRDVETGFTYIITDDEIIGPFQYGCYLFTGYLHASGTSKESYVIPYGPDGKLDLEAKAYRLG